MYRTQGPGVPLCAGDDALTACRTTISRPLLCGTFQPGPEPRHISMKRCARRPDLRDEVSRVEKQRIGRSARSCTYRHLSSGTSALRACTATYEALRREGMAPPFSPRCSGSPLTDPSGTHIKATIPACGLPLSVCGCPVRPASWFWVTEEVSGLAAVFPSIRFAASLCMI